MIRLGVIDDRAETPITYTFELPLPATGLSVFAAVKIAVYRARAEGFRGNPERASVHVGTTLMRPERAHSVYLQDDGRALVVTIFPPSAHTDVWELD